MIEGFMWFALGCLVSSIWAYFLNKDKIHNRKLAFNDVLDRVNESMADCEFKKYGARWRLQRMAFVFEALHYDDVTIPAELVIEASHLRRYLTDEIERLKVKRASEKAFQNKPRQGHMQLRIGGQDLPFYIGDDMTMRLLKKVMDYYPEYAVKAKASNEFPHTKEDYQAQVFYALKDVRRLGSMAWELKYDNYLKSLPKDGVEFNFAGSHWKPQFPKESAEAQNAVKTRT